MLLLIALGIMWVFPAILEVAFVLGMGAMYWLSKQKFHLPLRMPRSSGLLDHNDPNPGNGKPQEAGGIVFLGNEMGTGKELWVNASDAGTHFLVFGTTGAGKAIRDDAQVHTLKGWRRADTLEIGEYVTTKDGGQSKIVGVFPQEGELPLFRLSLDDGRSVDISGDHLWEVHPFRTTRPLTTVLPEAGEVIDTRAILSRLEQRQYAPGADGWAIPLNDAVDAPDVAWTGGVEAQAQRWLAALQSGQPWRGVGDEGSRAQRRALWKLLLQAGAGQPWCTVYGRARQLHQQHPDTVVALCALARSLGFWAKADGNQVWVKEHQQGARIVNIKALKEKAACRCFKIEDPRGLFLMDHYVVTHNTEALVSIAYNALVQGSGFIYVDGKGDNSLFMKIFSMARVAGREDDLLCINYMTGGRDVIGPQEDKLSNNLNPFAMGTAGALTQLLVSLMPSAGGGDGGMWQGRAVSFMGSLMMALTHMRDNGLIRLGVSQIRDHLTLEKVQGLAADTGLPSHVIEALRGYLLSLPGYEENPKEGKQGEITTEQHGYLQMQFTRVMSSLADDYGYIFNTTRGEVDFLDVVLNNRILTVLLPSLEKSPEELGNLGKIIVASLKSMMATGLGDRLEGAISETIDAKATNAPNPFLVILDEYGYYVVSGAAVMPAQARSLNFSMVFAGQDFPSFKKNNNKEEAEATAANCNVYVFMKLRDTTDTVELFSKAAGKAKVARISGYNRSSGTFGGGGYSDNQNASIQEEDRGNALDLAKQVQGEAHLIFKDAVVRAKMFYAAPPKPKHMRLNHFLRVEPPSSADMDEFSKRLERMRLNLKNDDQLAAMDAQVSLPTPFAVAEATLRDMIGKREDPAKAAMAALAAAYRLPFGSPDALGRAGERLSQQDEFDLDEDLGMNIFTEEPNDTGMTYVSARPTGTSLSQPGAAAPRPRHHIKRDETEDAIAEAEMASDVPPHVAQENAQRITEDLAAATRYPHPESVPDPISEPDFLGNILSGFSDDLDQAMAQGSQGSHASKDDDVLF